ncbi:MAG: hypothetical protein NTZ67_05005 [Gammaproteobacteria bacterium]|nr:hypothetical protein [Gammaproteobacteria bacterium]
MLTKPSHFSETIDLSFLKENQLETITGVSPDDASGFIIKNIRDINGDGMDDFIIGAPNANNGFGAAYLIFGSRNRQPFLMLFDLNGQNGFVITGNKKDSGTGFSASGLDDFNKDGIRDFMIGAPYVDKGAGACYVIFGARNIGSSGTLSLSTLNGKNGFKIFGVNKNDNSGTAIADVGDVNADGATDLLIGAPYANAYAGISYLVFGGSHVGNSGNFLLSDLIGSNGFKIPGITPGENSGASVTGKLDLNADGKSDFIIGALNANNATGTTYVVFGKPLIGESGIFSLLALNGKNGFKISGVSQNDNSGAAIHSAGDINNDGRSDLLIGAPNVKNGSGACYVLFGAANIGADGDFLLSNLTGNNGFVITNNYYAYGQMGYAVAAGSFNLNPIILIGAPGANMGAGSAYALFGARKIGYSGALDITELNGENGFNITNSLSINETGWSVALGDFNGDNVSDLGISTPFAKNSAGETYIVFGNAGSLSKSFSAAFTMTESLPSMTRPYLETATEKSPTLNSITASQSNLQTKTSSAKESISSFQSATANKINTDTQDQSSTMSQLKASQSLKLTKTSEIISKSRSFKSTTITIQKTASPALFNTHTKSKLKRMTSSELSTQTADVLKSKTTSQPSLSFSSKLTTSPETNSRSRLNSISKSQLSTQTADTLRSKTISQPSLSFSNKLTTTAEKISISHYPNSKTRKHKSSTTLFDTNSNSNSNSRLNSITNSQLQTQTSKTKSKSITITITKSKTTHNPLTLIRNALTITQGQCKLITSADLAATKNHVFDDNLLFMAMDIKKGHFEILNAVGIATLFSQKNITDGVIQFLSDGGITAPSYKIAVTDGFFTSQAKAANITFLLAFSNPENNNKNLQIILLSIASIILISYVLIRLLSHHYINKYFHMLCSDGDINGNNTTSNNRKAAIFITEGIFKSINTTNLIGYRNKVDTENYIAAFEIMTEKLNASNVNTNNYEKLTLAVAVIKSILSPPRNTCSPSRIYSLFKSEISPNQILEKMDLIVHEIQKRLLTLTEQITENSEWRESDSLLSMKIQH